MAERPAPKGPKDPETRSGIPIRQVYRPADLAGWRYEDQLGDPGEYPFTRGIHPNMYRGKLWTMRQYAGFGTAAETNLRFRYLLTVEEMDQAMKKQVGYRPPGH